MQISSSVYSFDGTLALPNAPLQTNDDDGDTHCQSCIVSNGRRPIHDFDKLIRDGAVRLLEDAAHG